MVRTNSVLERLNADGTIDYVVDLGNIQVDDRVVPVGSLVVPIRKQRFFTLPEDKGKYAVVNAYYDVVKGGFIFDRVLLTDKPILSYNSRAIPNLIPLAQFVVKQSVDSLTVEAVNEYARMSTFSVGDGGETGEMGLQGEVGPTGCMGYSGAQGWTGYPGDAGPMGFQGATGVGAQGSAGVQGATGVYPDLSLLMYYKFKTVSVVLVDYSPRQRDCTWTVTGIGVTGSSEGTSFLRETGIVDTCHSVTYRGDVASYKLEEYIDFYGFTGVAQAWVRVDVPPAVDFSYTGVAGVTGVLRFTEQCKYFPETWSWQVDGTNVSTSKIFTTPVLTGEHLVKLESSNPAGSMSKTKLVVMP